MFQIAMSKLELRFVMGTRGLSILWIKVEVLRSTRDQIRRLSFGSSSRKESYVSVDYFNGKCKKIL